MAAGWLLLIAPRSHVDVFHPERPIARWDHVASFTKREACEKHRDQIIVYLDTHQRAFTAGGGSISAAKLLRCVSSDDPDLAE
jgi:hypothetical protein